MSNTMKFDVDKARHKIKVERPFNAPRNLVWAAWTQQEILDQWWAPHPWKTETKSLEFREGGRWHYAMAGPDGSKHWSLADYEKIEPENTIVWSDAFCDENCVIITDFSRSRWHITFENMGNDTMVYIEISFKQLEDLEKIIEMGFKEGFTAGLENLDHYLKTHYKMRHENGAGKAPRVTSYLNFPGNTEEVFNFYREVFNGEFSGKGLQRFGDLELPGEHPPMSEEDKKLIIHAELTIMGGHVLMATDAPESMGFKLQSGNNMHISLEPDSLDEAERLFKALSVDGEIEMPLQQMFWGGWYAGFKDRFGINWMINFNEPNN